MSSAGNIDLLGRLDAIVFEAQAATLQLGFVAGGALARLGFPASEWLEDPQFLVRRLGGDEREALLTLMRAAATDGQPRRMEHAMIAADGSERWFRTEINAIDRGQRLLVLMIDATLAHETARALRETEARLREVIDKAPIILMALDREGCFTLVEGSGLRALKLDANDLLGRSALELMAHEETVPGHIRRALAGETLIATDYVRGFDSWWETRWTPLFDSLGQPAGASAVALDVSARSRAELQLAQTISLLRATLEATTDGVLVVDTAGRIVDYNRRFVEMWHLSRDSLNAGNDAAALAEAVDQLRDPDGFLAKVRALYAEPESNSHDILEFRDGRVFSRDSHPQRVDGACVGRVWSFRDVTAEHRATRRAAFLAEASKVLAVTIADETALAAIARLAVPYLGDWCNIVLIDDRHTLRLAASHHRDPSRIATMHQVVPPRVDPHRGIGIVLHAGRTAMFNDVSEAEMTGAVNPRNAFSSNEPIVGQRLVSIGMRHWLGAPILVRGRVVGGLFFGSTDVARPYCDDDIETAQDLAQRAALALENQWLYRSAQQAVVLRDEFLSVASHELRTPVTSLMLAVQSALTVGLQADSHDGFLRQVLQSAERQTRRLGRLVDALLDVSRIEAGRLELNREPMDLAQLARDVVNVLGEDLRRAGCEVVLDVPAQLVGPWDRARLEQVLTNLLSNAFKYGAGKPIDVIVSGGDMARLTVRDRGIGVPDSERDRIFERFERAVSARHYGGLGLGLYIVRRIVDAHGGHSMVTSPEGGGAAFTVELPLQ